ncbi:DUF1538 domain-containing protein [Natronospora cellulosivora (SeqCode)]
MNGIVIFEGLWERVLEVSVALLPLIIFFIFFQIVYLKLPRSEISNMFKGVILSFLGIVLFLQGVHVGLLPVGEILGEVIIEESSKIFVVFTGFIMGLVATFAEPAVIALTEEVEKVSSGYLPQKVLLSTLSIGVGFAIALAMLRIFYGIPLMYLLIPGYGMALLLTFFSKEKFISIAFDSGGVATGPMTVTFIMAFSVGVASQIEGRDPLIEGFGMIALVALIPIISVLLLGLIYLRKEKENERELEDES